jgi:hypothetical protein
MVADRHYKRGPTHDLIPHPAVETALETIYVAAVHCYDAGNAGKEL